MDYVYCFLLRTYKIKNLARKERKEREKELYTVLCCARSWHNSLVKGSCCVHERNRKIQEKGTQVKLGTHTELWERGMRMKRYRGKM